MKRLRVLLLRLLGIFASPRHDAEFDEELEALLQFHIAEHLRSGMTPAEARRQALIRIGGTQSVKQAYRDQRGLPAVETTLQDVRFGARMLRRQRGYTAVAFLTLALGIGMTITGVAIGVLVATLAAHSLGTLLFEVSPLDPQVYATAVMFVLGVAIVACCIPARRAMHADPVTALRQE